MPRLMATKDDQVINIPGPGNFQFSAIRIDDLGASEYTLVTIICDISGSVAGYADELLNCIKSIVGACQKSARSENLLLRLLYFNQSIVEIHGFKDLKSIDINDYKPIQPDGMTALYDATFDGIGAALEFGKKLRARNYDDVNAVTFIITDGMDNRSKIAPKDIAAKVALAKKGEQIESSQTFLIALNDPNTGYAAEVTRYLSTFQAEAQIDKFIDVGDATKEALQHLAGWVSGSISSASQVVGSGAASQVLAF
jgi:uncharacterized protein YegL